jgi:NHL repeat
MGVKSFEREFTAHESTLKPRYTDKKHMKSIDLPSSDQTQPVDLCIDLESNRIYACDIGRSFVEIYNINGTLEHVIDDTTMTKFQPTAIAVASDGTVIVASHFHHRLHMYSPSDSQNPVNRYVYKQFKLGTSGDQIHQFYHPAGIALDHKNGNLYVCDRGNFRIQVMRPEGVCERVIELFSAGKKKTPLDVTRVALQSHLNQIVCIVANGDALCFLPKQANG